LDTSRYPGLDFYTKSISEANYWGKYIRCPIEDFLSNKVAEIREAVFRGQMTGAEGAKKLQEQAEQEWQNQGLG
jgi:hypothetical protein